MQDTCKYLNSNLRLSLEWSQHLAFGVFQLKNTYRQTDRLANKKAVVISSSYTYI